MDLHCEMILDDYRERKPFYEKMKEIALGEIQKAIDSAGIEVLSVAGRVKTEKSLTGKLELKGSKYKSLDDLTDILGLRVITIFTEDVDRIAALISNLFEIDWENSVDKRKMHDVDSFGYNSLHYICRIPKSMYSDPACPQINEVRFELQMRTSLQHLWSTVSHDSGYKSDVEIPSSLIRNLYRLAGVLEMVDEEFSRLRTDISDYRFKVASLVSLGEFSDVAIDGDTYKSYLELHPFDQLNKKIAAINQAEIQPVSLQKYLKVFKYLGFKSLADIEKLQKDYGDDAYQLAVSQISGTDLDIIGGNIGVQNLLVAYVLRNGGREHELINLFEQIDGPSNYNAERAARILDLGTSLGLSHA